jgi:hypothetical protein
MKYIPTVVAAVFINLSEYGLAKFVLFFILNLLNQLIKYHVMM